MIIGIQIKVSLYNEYQLTLFYFIFGFRNFSFQPYFFSKFSYFVIHFLQYFKKLSQI